MRINKVNIAILMIAMLLLSGCNNVSEDVSEEEVIVLDSQNQNDNDEIQPYVFRVDLDAERAFYNRIKKKNYEEALAKEVQEKIENQTKYIKSNGIKIYTDETLTSVSGSLDKRDKIYVEEVMAEKGIALIKKDYNSKVLGYIKSDSYHNQLTDFISRKYEGVDYEYEIKRNDFENNPRVKAKGIYLTLSTVTDPVKLDYLIKKANETEINAFVIDVKNDSDTLLFKSEAAKKYNPKAYENFYTKDLDAIMKKLKDNNIYTIARIVCFKSPQYAVENPERAITYKGTSTVYKNNNGVAWASAYDRELWAYNIEVAKEAAEYGFNEIQFDYVRFPALSRSVRSKLDFKNERNENRSQAIHTFLKTAQKELEKEEVYLAADIFGWSASSLSDEGIGQHWEALVTAIDFSCPMIYPSHYGPGIFGLSVPDAYPYQTVYESTYDAIQRNKNVKNPADLRPWIQDFSAPWVKGYIRYGKDEVKAQIDALKDLGVDEYILWAPGNNYTWEAIDPIQN